jgi:hypothetical protein
MVSEDLTSLAEMCVDEPDADAVVASNGSGGFGVYLGEEEGWWWRTGRLAACIASAAEAGARRVAHIQCVGDVGYAISLHLFNGDSDHHMLEIMPPSRLVVDDPDGGGTWTPI